MVAALIRGDPKFNAAKHISLVIGRRSLILRNERGVLKCLYCCAIFALSSNEGLEAFFNRDFPLTERLPLVSVRSYNHCEERVLLLRER